MTTDHSNSPAWKQLITRTLTVDERISLMNTIFSDRDQIEIVGGLSGDDAQRFIDTADKVHPHVLSPQKDRCDDSHSPFSVLLVRCWIVSCQKSARVVYALRTGSVTTKPCFQDRS